jgi:hypothetical protein
MTGTDQYLKLKSARERWLALGLPDITDDVVVLRNIPKEKIPEIREIASTLGIKRLTFFNLPDNGRRPPGTT